MPDQKDCPECVLLRLGELRCKQCLQLNHMDTLDRLRKVRADAEASEYCFCAECGETAEVWETRRTGVGIVEKVFCCGRGRQRIFSWFELRFQKFSYVFARDLAFKGTGFEFRRGIPKTDHGCIVCGKDEPAAKVPPFKCAECVFGEPKGGPLDSQKKVTQ